MVSRYLVISEAVCHQFVVAVAVRVMLYCVALWFISYMLSDLDLSPDVSD